MSRRPPDEVCRTLLPDIDREGPNRDMSRLPYKFAFYRALLAELRRWRRRGLRVVCAGDLNTAHMPIDLARPRA